MSAGTVEVKRECHGWQPKLTSLWTRLLRHCKPLRRPLREMRVQETVGLGEKRFVAIVACGEHRFLIGGAANSVCLLATLPAQTKFRDLLRQVHPQGVVR